MKKEFNKVDVEIIDLNNADVITSSGADEPQSVGDNPFNSTVVGIGQNNQFNTLD